MEHLVADWKAAFDLRWALENGHSPTPVPSAHFVSETCFAVLPAKVERRVGIELAYPGQSSQVAAAARWEVIEVGEMALTSTRLALLPSPNAYRPRPSVVSWGWQGHVHHWGEMTGSVVEYEPISNRQRKLYRFVTPRPIWFHVLLCAVAFHELGVIVPPPPQVASQLRRQ